MLLDVVYYYCFLTIPLVPELTPALKAALMKLASSEQAAFMRTYLRSLILEAAEDGPLELTRPRPILKNWLSGCEALQKKTMDEAWAMVGLSAIKRIPFFMLRIDPAGGYTSWTDAGRNWFRNPQNGVDFNVQWHQLIAVVRMIQMAFDGKSFLSSNSFYYRTAES